MLLLIRINNTCTYHPSYNYIGGKGLLKSVRLIRISNVLLQTAESALLLQQYERVMAGAILSLPLGPDTAAERSTGIARLGSEFILRNIIMHLL